MLSDVGGIQGILISTFSMFLTLLNYKYFDQFMASKLYKIKREDADEVQQSKKDYFQRSTFFKPTKYGNLRLYMMDLLPSKCVCCRRNRQERGIIKAMEAMDKEIDIVELIKSRRFMKMAIRKLLSDRVRMELKQRSRY